MDAERLLKQFNLTTDAAAAVLAAQGSRCPICGRELDASKPSVVGDHNHADGTFRGFLCFLCNRALVLFGDDPARLAAAIEYLKAPPAYSAVGRVYGCLGRKKAGSVPRNRRAQFFSRTQHGTDGIVYQCGCRDTAPRPKKTCPVHGQPSRGPQQ